MANPHFWFEVPARDPGGRTGPERSEDRTAAPASGASHLDPLELNSAEPEPEPELCPVPADVRQFRAS